VALVESENHPMRVLASRSDMTGADRAWAARYEVGDVLHYQRGSTAIGIEPRSYARVVSTDPKANLLTVEKPDGQQVTYDPSRLRGISAYREIEREFQPLATGCNLPRRIRNWESPTATLEPCRRSMRTAQ
jgi:hypothetical protein